MAIKVSLEGREGVYLLTKEVVDLINKEETLQALLLEPNCTIAHQFVCTTTKKRYMFDVGKITINDLEVQNG